MPPSDYTHFADRNHAVAARHGSLAHKIHQLHDNGAYSDLTIVCGSDTYHVHKAIICPQSDWFTAACRPDTFKEGKTNIINIPASLGRDEFTNPLINPEDFDWDLDVETTESVKLMIHYFYHHDYLEEGLGSTGFWRADSFAENSRMYAMGDKYGVPGLKDVALAKFSNPYHLKFTAKMVVTAAVIAFSSTPDSDKRLREMMVSHVFVANNLPIIEHSLLIQKVILAIPKLAYGLYRMLLDPQKRRHRARVSHMDRSQGEVEEATIAIVP